MLRSESVEGDAIPGVVEEEAEEKALSFAASCAVMEVGFSNSIPMSEDDHKQ